MTEFVSHRFQTSAACVEHTDTKCEGKVSEAESRHARRGLVCVPRHKKIQDNCLRCQYNLWDPSALMSTDSHAVTRTERFRKSKSSGNDMICQAVLRVSENLKRTGLVAQSPWYGTVVTHCCSCCHQSQKNIVRAKKNTSEGKVRPTQSFNQ